MKHFSLQNKDRVERLLRHQAPPYALALGAWVASKRVKPGHEVSFNQCFHKPEPMQAMRREIFSLFTQTME